MKVSLETLRRLWEGAEFHGIPAGIVFDKFNVAHIKEFDLRESRGGELYFVVYEDEPAREGWYLNPFDRASNLAQLSRTTDLVFVVDQRVPEHQMRGLKYVRVQNIFSAIDTIREYAVSLVGSRVVGVTGSVGKTTAAAILQRLLGPKFGCGRVYSKRLTPLTLSSWLVNELDPSHRFISLEYSMYRPHHVVALMRILKPEIGVLLNIKSVHLGVAGVNTLLDIREAKRPLVEEARFAVLNADDELVISLRKKGDLTFSLDNHTADAFIESDGAVVTAHLNLTGESFRFRPHVRTDLFYYQVLASVLVASSCGLGVREIQEALKGFMPAENRIGWITIAGQRALFDGDITVAGRLSALAENRYQSAVLLVAKFNFGEEDVALQATYFSEVFGNFSEVRVLDEPENREVLTRYGIANYHLVPRERFLEGISDFEFKVVHFGGYFRKHKALDHLLMFISP